MKIFIDNETVKQLVHNTSQIKQQPLLSNSDNELVFEWPSLLEYLGLGSILSNLPAFNETQPLFKACVSTLCKHEEKEVLFYVYDRLFTEVLNQIRELPQLNASFLLQAIKEQRQKASFVELEKILSPALTAYEIALTTKASHAIPDLILYLAWDRMCVCMACLFDYQSTNPLFIKGIDVLKECLIESYHHLIQQGQTSPGIYRMLESLVFYQMREENLQKHTDAEWTILSQSLQTLKAQDKLIDIFYIDHAVVPEEKDSKCYLILETPESVNSRLILAQCMMNKLKAEVPDWSYAISPQKIVHF